MVEQKQANLVTSTNLRKYVATILQLLDMNEKEMGCLGDNL